MDQKTKIKTKQKLYIYIFIFVFYIYINSFFSFYFSFFIYIFILYINVIVLKCNFMRYKTMTNITMKPYAQERTQEITWVELNITVIISLGYIEH